MVGIASVDLEAGAVRRRVEQDAFHKLREQIILCQQEPRQQRGGLNMINSTNLEFFNSKQKAELFRLKGIFLTSPGAKQEANNAYSQAVQVSRGRHERRGEGGGDRGPGDRGGLGDVIPYRVHALREHRGCVPRWRSG